jgi:tetratricopeptide (TPR) repeat protein
VFEGGFTLESVEAVLDLRAYENAPSPMDALQSLVHKSFVRLVNDARFDLLVSVQEYAAEHLRTVGRYTGSGPAALLAAETRHGEYFAGLDAKAAIADRCAELDNLVVACRRAAARDDAELAANALEGAWAGLSLRGPFGVGAVLASLVQAIPEIGAAAAAKVHWVAGRTLAASGKDFEAHAQFEASLARAREIGNRRSECRALIGLASSDSHAGRMAEARPEFEAALAIAREMNDRTLQSDAYNGRGTMETLLGRSAEARADFETSLALARSTGEREREGRILGNLGILHSNAGRMEESRLHDEAALAVALEIGNRQLEGNTRSNLGLLYEVQGRFSEAVEQLEAALAVARDLGHARLECIVLCNLGMVYDGLARVDDARHHFEAALAIARELGDRRSEGQFLGYLGLLHARQAVFDEARGCLDSGETLLRAVSDRVSLGILLCGRAEMEHLAGMPDDGCAALSEAGELAVEVGAGSDSELGLALARVRNLLGRGPERG